MSWPVNLDAVSFDVGGTLIAPHPSVGHVYAEVAARHGVANLSPELLNRQFSAAWRAKKNFNHTREDWAGLVEQTFVGLTHPAPRQSFFPALYQRLGEAHAWRIYDDVLPALEALASKGIPMAVISNWDERLRPLLKQLRLEGYFEEIVVSCEVAFTKPSQVIFEHATQKLGLPPESIVHVGDSFIEDYEGARAAGLHALLLDRNSSVTGDGQIRSLRELEFVIFGAESP